MTKYMSSFALVYSEIKLSFIQQLFFFYFHNSI